MQRVTQHSQLNVPQGIQQQSRGISEYLAAVLQEQKVSQMVASNALPLNQQSTAASTPILTQNIQYESQLTTSSDALWSVESVSYPIIWIYYTIRIVPTTNTTT